MNVKKEWLKKPFVSSDFLSGESCSDYKTIKKALEYTSLTGEKIVIDAHCSVGTIALFLSQKAKKAYGVEVVKEAMAAAKENTMLNNIENVEFICEEAEIVIPWLYKKSLKADVVAVDSPRKVW